MDGTDMDTSSIRDPQILNVLEDFLSTGDRQYFSPNTKRHYRTVLNAYNTYIQDTRGHVARVEHLTRINLEGYFGSRTELSDVYHHLQYGKINTLCKWLTAEGYFPTNPMNNVARRPSRNPKRGQPRLTDDQSEAFFALLDGGDFILRAFVLFMARTARRLGEGTKSFHWRDVQLTPTETWPNGVYTFTEHKKHHRRVTMPLDPITREMLISYRAEYQAKAIEDGILSEGHPIPGDWAVFPPYLTNGKYRINPFGESTRFGVKIRNLAKKLGIYTEGWATHALRRWAADYIYRMKGLEAAQTLLNHESPFTTGKYLNVEDKKVRLAQHLADAWGPTPPAAQPERTPVVVDGGAQVISLFGRRNAG